MQNTIYVRPEYREIAITCARGGYQAAALSVDASWEGSRWAASRRNLATRMRAAGLLATFVLGRGDRTILIVGYRHAATVWLSYAEIPGDLTPPSWLRRVQREASYEFPALVVTAQYAASGSSYVELDPATPDYEAQGQRLAAWLGSMLTAT